MYCPEHLVFDKGPLTIWMYYADVPKHTIPLHVWLNLLRYEIVWRRPQKDTLTINRNGYWARDLSNAIYRVKAWLGLVPKLP